MIGIISIDGNNPNSNQPTAGLILPDNLVEASSWSFVARPVQTPSSVLLTPNSSGDIQERVLKIRKHLREGMDYLGAQLKSLHEAIGAIEGIGQLVSRRDQGLYPRIPESQLQEEFEILRTQLEGIRQRTFFNQPLFGNGATPSLKIHTSLWDIPRHEEVSTANLESLSLRLIYWGRLAGEGIQSPIHAKTVEDALRHLLESALKNQSEQERLRNVFKSLAGAVQDPDASDVEEESSVELHSTPAVAGTPLPEIDQSEDFLARLKSWIQQLLPGFQSNKCNDKNFHHNQDAVS